MSVKLYRSCPFSRRRFLQVSGMGGLGMAVAGCQPATRRVGPGATANGNGPSRVIMVGVRRDDDAAREAAFRWLMDEVHHTSPRKIATGEQVTVKATCNSRFKYPTTASPFSAAQSARWAADTTGNTGMVTVGDHCGTYPGLVGVVERDGDLDSYGCLERNGVLGAVQDLGLSNVEVAGWDYEDPKNSDYLHTPKKFLNGEGYDRFPYDRVIAPGADLWRRDLDEDVDPITASGLRMYDGVNLEKDTLRARFGQLYENATEEDGFMNISGAVSPDRYFINVCRIGSHALAGVTYSLKSLVGILDLESRLRMHVMLPDQDFLLDLDLFGGGLGALNGGDLANVVGQIGAARKPEFTVVDASKILLSFGPDGGSVYDFGFDLYLASTDMVALDAHCLALHRYGYHHINRGIPPLATVAPCVKDEQPDIWNHPMIATAQRTIGGPTWASGIDRTMYAYDNQEVAGVPSYDPMVGWAVDQNEHSFEDVTQSVHSQLLDSPAGG